MSRLMFTEAEASTVERMAKDLAKYFDEFNAIRVGLVQNEPERGLANIASVAVLSAAVSAMCRSFTRTEMLMFIELQMEMAKRTVAVPAAEPVEPA